MADHLEDLTQAMNNIVLEDEEEGGIALEDYVHNEFAENHPTSNVKLCLVGKFLTEGIFDFQAMQQTLAPLWKPGKGV